MKRQLLSVISVSLTGLASAESGVTLFGVADAMVGNYRTAGMGSTTKLNSGGLSASRLGLRGAEDLGGGWSAGFWLEAQIAFNAGTGSTTNTNNQPSGTVGSSGLTFNRRSTVSLSSPLGEVRLGRDYVPTFWNFAMYDPFYMFGVASASNLNFAGTSGPSVNVARNSNSIGFLYNSASIQGRSGWYGQAQYALGENSSASANPSDGKSAAFLMGYASGPWNGSIGYAKTKMLANKDFSLANAGASWDFGVARAMLEYSVANSGLPGTKFTTYLVGAKIPIGLGYFPVSVASSRQNNAAGSHAVQYAAGYVYFLSKRTAVYSNYARIANSSGAAFAVGSGLGLPGAPNAASSGLELGIQHVF